MTPEDYRLQTQPNIPRHPSMSTAYFYFSGLEVEEARGFRESLEGHRVDLAELFDRPRLDETLDSKAGNRQIRTDFHERAAVKLHFADPLPIIFHKFHRKVVVVLRQLPVDGRVVRGKHENSVRLKDAMEFAERWEPIFEVVQNERAEDQVERSGFRKVEWLRQIGLLNYGAITHSRLSKLDEVMIEIKGNESGAMSDKMFRIPTGPTASIEDQLILEFREQGKCGGAFDVRVPGAGIDRFSIAVRDRVVGGACMPGHLEPDRVTDPPDTPTSQLPSCYVAIQSGGASAILVSVRKAHIRAYEFESMPWGGLRATSI